MFSHISFLISVTKQRGPGLQIRGESPGSWREEPSHTEAEQVDRRGVAALPDSLWQIDFFQDDSNISHPTSSSRTFCSPTKKWSLIPFPVNLGRFVTHLLPMECSGSDTAMLLEPHRTSCPGPPCCEKARLSPGRDHVDRLGGRGDGVTSSRHRDAPAPATI